MAYVDYAYYTDTYHGVVVPAASFDRLAQRASETIDQVTFGRAAAVTDEATVALIKQATCAVIEEISREDPSGKEIQSEKVGNTSVTYIVRSSNERRRRDAAKRHLWNTDLMYRGLDAD